MRFAWGLLLGVTACGPSTYVVVSPSEAAELSAEYHGRVTVTRVVPAGTNRPVTMIGALTAEGTVVTSANKRIDLDPDDQVQLRIHYVDGDRDPHGGGIIHAGVSGEKVGGGITLAILGSMAFAGTVAGATANCVQPPPNDGLFAGFDSLGYGLCVIGWGALGGAALTTIGAGIALTIRGALNTNLTVTPIGSATLRGASLKLDF